MTMLVLQAAVSAPNYLNNSLVMSANGGVLAWMGAVSGQTTAYEVFVHDVASGLTRKLGAINPALTGVQADWPALSADGSTVAFVEANTGRVGVLTLASGVLHYATAAATTPAAPGKYAPPSLSANGRWVAFESAASDLVAGDSNGIADVFVRDMLTGGITRIEGLGGPAATPQLSADGQSLVFRGGNQIYLKNLASGALSVASSSSGGVPIADGALWQQFELADSGRYLTFSASGSAIGTDGARNFINVYVKDLVSGELRLLDSGTPGQQIVNEQPEIASDGQLATYISREFGTHAQMRPEYLVQERDVAASHFNPSAEAGMYLGESTFSGDGAILGLVFRSAGVVYHPELIELSSLLRDGALAPGAGDDRIEGSTAIDTLAYEGRRAEYTIVNRVVTDSQTARNGSDTLGSVERLHFSDGNIALDTAGAAGQAFRLYQAAFDRAPDEAGAGFWIRALDQGQSLVSVAAGFIASPEFKSVFGGATGNGQLVEQLYQHILHRAGDSAGIAFWTRALDEGRSTLPEVLVGFSESTENVAALTGVLQGGVAYLPYV